MVRTAVEKRDQTGPATVEELTEARGANFPVGRLLVSTPRELDAIIRRIPEGRVLTLGALRGALARDRNADYTCPLTTGIFLRIVAEAAEEERAASAPRLAPYWRVVRDDGTLIDRLPGGATAQARALEKEGVHVLHLGKRHALGDVDHYAWNPPPLGKAGRGRAPAGKTGR
jgi:alkylated DNA nucleotide flippase Atl1